MIAGLYTEVYKQFPILSRIKDNSCLCTELIQRGRSSLVRENRLVLYATYTDTLFMHLLALGFIGDPLIQGSPSVRACITDPCRPIVTILLMDSDESYTRIAREAFKLWDGEPKSINIFDRAFVAIDRAISAARSEEQGKKILGPDFFTLAKISPRAAFKKLYLSSGLSLLQSRSVWDALLS